MGGGVSAVGDNGSGVVGSEGMGGGVSGVGEYWGSWLMGGGVRRYGWWGQWSRWWGQKVWVLGSVE